MKLESEISKDELTGWFSTLNITDFDINAFVERELHKGPLTLYSAIKLLNHACKAKEITNISSTQYLELYSNMIKKFVPDDTTSADQLSIIATQIINPNVNPAKITDEILISHLSLLAISHYAIVPGHLENLDLFNGTKIYATDLARFGYKIGADDLVPFCDAVWYRKLDEYDSQALFGVANYLNGLPISRGEEGYQFVTSAAIKDYNQRGTTPDTTFKGQEFTKILFDFLLSQGKGKLDLLLDIGLPYVLDSEGQQTRYSIPDEIFNKIIDKVVKPSINKEKLMECRLEGFGDNLEENIQAVKDFKNKVKDISIGAALRTINKYKNNNAELDNLVEITRLLQTSDPSMTFDDVQDFLNKYARYLGSNPSEQLEKLCVVNSLILKLPDLKYSEAIDLFLQYPDSMDSRMDEFDALLAKVANLKKRIPDATPYQSLMFSQQHPLAFNADNSINETYIRSLEESCISRFKTIINLPPFSVKKSVKFDLAVKADKFESLKSVANSKFKGYESPWARMHLSVIADDLLGDKYSCNTQTAKNQLATLFNQGYYPDPSQVKFNLKWVNEHNSMSREDKIILMYEYLQRPDLFSNADKVSLKNMGFPRAANNKTLANLEQEDKIVIRLIAHLIKEYQNEPWFSLDVQNLQQAKLSPKYQAARELLDASRDFLNGTKREFNEIQSKSQAVIVASVTKEVDKSKLKFGAVHESGVGLGVAKAFLEEGMELNVSSAKPKIQKAVGELMQHAKEVARVRMHDVVAEGDTKSKLLALSGYLDNPQAYISTSGLQLKDFLSGCPDGIAIEKITSSQDKIAIQLLASLYKTYGSKDWLTSNKPIYKDSKSKEKYDAIRALKSECEKFLKADRTSVRSFDGIEKASMLLVEASVKKSLGYAIGGDSKTAEAVMTIHAKHGKELSFDTKDSKQLKLISKMQKQVQQEVQKFKTEQAAAAKPAAPSQG